MPSVADCRQRAAPSVQHAACLQVALKMSIMSPSCSLWSAAAAAAVCQRQRRRQGQRQRQTRHNKGAARQKITWQIACPKYPVVFRHTPCCILLSWEGWDSQTLHVAAASSLLLLHNVSSDCDDTWVQTSRLLPPDNALIALQRQPVGNQGSYCLGRFLPKRKKRCPNCVLSMSALHFVLSILCPLARLHAASLVILRLLSSALCHGL